MQTNSVAKIDRSEQDMHLPGQSSHQKFYYLITAFLYGAAFMRTVLIYWNRVEIFRGMGLLLVWLILFASLEVLSAKWRGYFPLYLSLQTAVTLLLLFMPIYPDYFAVLFAILSMQIMQRYSIRTGAVILALFVPATVLPIIPSVGAFQAAALLLVYTSVIFSSHPTRGMFGVRSRPARKTRP